MNQNDLIDRIHAIVNPQSDGLAPITKTEVKRVLESLGIVTTSEMMEGGEVPLPGIGKLKADTRAARTGRNPQTGAAVEIPAKNVVKFVMAKTLKDALA